MRFPFHRTFAVALASGAAIVIVLATAQFSRASHQISSTGHYSHSNGSCTSKVDPVTIVFTGSASTGNVNQNLIQHTALDHGASPFPQNFSTSGQCLQQTVDKSSCALLACTRDHIRGRQAAVTNPTYGTTTQATPHHEDWVTAAIGCFPGNHAVDKGGLQTGGTSGFDRGRTLVFNGFNGQSGHTITTFNWGNTMEFAQCDGDMAGSNGLVYYITIPHGH